MAPGVQISAGTGIVGFAVAIDLACLGEGSTGNGIINVSKLPPQNTSVKAYLLSIPIQHEESIQLQQTQVYPLLDTQIQTKVTVSCNSS